MPSRGTRRRSAKHVVVSPILAVGALCASAAGFSVSRPLIHLKTHNKRPQNRRSARRSEARCSLVPDWRVKELASQCEPNGARGPEPRARGSDKPDLRLLRYRRQLHPGDVDTQRAAQRLSDAAPTVQLQSTHEIVTLLLPATSGDHLITSHQQALAAILPADEGWCAEGSGALLPRSNGPGGDDCTIELEYGPQLHIASPWGVNAVGVLRAAGLLSVLRAEHSRRYVLAAKAAPPGAGAEGSGRWSPELVLEVGALLHDQMTEELYCTSSEDDANALFAPFSKGVAIFPRPRGHQAPANEASLKQTSFFAGQVASYGECLSWRRPPPVPVPLFRDGAAALLRFGERHGLGWGDLDAAMYGSLFSKLGRDPTEEELFGVGQSNSEHCRHWFFRGRLVIDGVARVDSLLDTVKRTLAEQERQAAVEVALRAVADEDCGRKASFGSREAAAAAGNSILAFCDNSSGIRGALLPVMHPSAPAFAAPYAANQVVRHIIATAETHNFPCGVAPFPGAATGVGGRLRDVHATGRGAAALAGVAGYCVGALRLPGGSSVGARVAAAAAGIGGSASSACDDDLAVASAYGEPEYPKELATPLEILLRASDGASDYANSYGEPLVAGFARSCRLDGQAVNDGGAIAGDEAAAASAEGAAADSSFGAAGTTGESAPWRAEWLKPIMFSAGVGALDAEQTTKAEPRRGMLLVKIGGPAYRVGLGGGSASSRTSSSASAVTAGDVTQASGGGEHALVAENNAGALDVRAVQRGDPEMGNKLGRAVRALSELGAANPVKSLHDQGAGGNANVLKELAAPAGGVLAGDAFPVGDARLTALELWGSEYQEAHALLCEEGPGGFDVVRSVCAREGVPVAAVGRVTGDGRLVFLERVGAEFASAGADPSAILDLLGGGGGGFARAAAPASTALLLQQKEGPASPASFTSSQVLRDGLGKSAAHNSGGAVAVREVLRIARQKRTRKDTKEPPAYAQPQHECALGWRKAVDLPLGAILNDVPRRTYNLQTGGSPSSSAAPAKGDDRLAAVLSADDPSDVKRLLRGVLSLVSAGSKAFLTSKIDRSVGGLVARQPCCGPFQLPVADVGVTALSHFSLKGAAVAVGECPAIALLDPAAMARMAVGEALTNLAFAAWEGEGLLGRTGIKCSANWMWPPPAAEADSGAAGAALARAVDAMAESMQLLGLAADGGKDSLSMAAATRSHGAVAAPPALVVTAYASCLDVRRVLTPDLKGHLPAGENTLSRRSTVTSADDVASLRAAPRRGGKSAAAREARSDSNSSSGGSAAAAEEEEAVSGGVIVHLDFGNDRRRLGGSALAQSLGALGTQPPDLEPAAAAGLAEAVDALQQLLKERPAAVLAGHDVGSGGLVTTLLEMAFSGDAGIDLDVPLPKAGPDREPGAGGRIAALFSEELGIVLELSGRPGVADEVLTFFAERGVRCSVLGRSTERRRIEVRVDGEAAISSGIDTLRAAWEGTSRRLDRLQTDPSCVLQEAWGARRRSRPQWHVPFVPRPPLAAEVSAPPQEELQQRSSQALEITSGSAAEDVQLRSGRRKPRVAILREEGSNGDREMAAAFAMAGFEPWDVTATDLMAGSVDLSSFRGIAFVGGFSFADVLGSARGWAARLYAADGAAAQQLEAFRKRPDTFSLGVCNGCQLMALLGWVGKQTETVNGSGSSSGRSSSSSSDDGSIRSDAGGSGGGAEASSGSTCRSESKERCSDASGGSSGGGVRFVRNTSGRFESHFVTVAVRDSPSVLLRGMAGTTVGVWTAHGEGRLASSSSAATTTNNKSGSGVSVSGPTAGVVPELLAPIVYTDDSGVATESYPMNPNGSPGGVAALCSEDGRHLAVMPHPERCFLSWQMPWAPPDWAAGSGGGGGGGGSGGPVEASPWMQIFHNAYDFCMATGDSGAAADA